MSRALDLVESFNKLSVPTAAGGGLRFSAVPIAGFEAHRIGKDVNGNPSLLIAVRSSDGGWPPPILLEHLSVQHDVDCRIALPSGASETGRFTLVRCIAANETLERHFLTIVAPIVEIVGKAPSSSDVNSAVNRLVQLFRAMTGPPRKTIQGLWAEVLVIARSRDPHAMIRAWHVDPGDRFDYSAGGQRVEVKSTSGGIRQHHFVLDQLRPIAGTDVLIASLFVERAGGGVALVDLVADLTARIADDPALVLRIDEVVVATLGTAWQSSLGDRFDRQLAETSLAFYDANDVPRIDHVPPQITDVSFRSDLSYAQPVDIRGYRLGLFAAAARR